MNKDFLQGMSPEEQEMARTLDAISADMHVSCAFEKHLELRLLSLHGQKSQPASSWMGRILPAVGWAMLALLAVWAVNWGARSLIAINATAGDEITEPASAFADEVKTGAICQGPLVLGHNSSVFLIDPETQAFSEVDEGREIGELRTFSWSTDGQSMAIAGPTRGSGNLYLFGLDENSLQPLVADSTLGYLNGVSWSRDGEQLLTWEIRDPSVFFLVARDGSRVVRQELPVKFLETPQFSPDGKSVLFLGADQTTSGLFQVAFDSLQPSLLSGMVESTGSFAWSPDGSRLAYFEVDRSAGEARLVIEGEAGKTVIASLSVPTGSGSSIPGTANLSWTPDGNALVFEFGQYTTKRAFYIAPIDGDGLVKLAEPAYASAISSDGRCVAYISNRQVFLMDLAASLADPGEMPKPILIGELPSGRGRANVQLDRLEWKPDSAAPTP